MLGQKINLDRVVRARRRQARVLRSRACVSTAGARPFSLTLGDGEIVAVTGLVGVGKTALAETLFGAAQAAGRQDDVARRALRAAHHRRRDRGRRVPRRQGPRRKRHRRRTSTSTKISACRSSGRMSRFGVRKRRAERAHRARGRSPILASSAARKRTRWRRCRAATSKRSMVGALDVAAGETVHPRRAVPGRRHRGAARHRRQAAGKRRRPRDAASSSPNSTRRWRRPTASW